MSSVKATKKSAFSCEPCRRRKVKCGGEQPACKRCQARKDECIYKLNPTLSYTQRLEERIKELENRLAAVSRSPPSVTGSSAHSSPSVIPHPPYTSDPISPDDKSIGPSFRGLKLDEKGGITYHGTTSFFHLPSDPPAAIYDKSASTDQDVQRRRKLVNNAWQQRALESSSDIPQPFLYLLNVHWCWIQPLFNFIYRPAFTRDMQSLGPYYSHTLLNAVLSHSIRWGKSDPSTKRLLDESYEGGAIFAKHARSMLFDELSRGVCNIPTVQTLLLLSAQECGYGNTTQAWTYSGLAFRLLDHLGLCLDGQRYPGQVPLSDEDLEIRRRLFWSCYFWDKMISLYLGRSPSLEQSSVSPPQAIFDDSSENEIWVPIGIVHGEAASHYPPTTAHSTSALMNMCRLSLIFNEILKHMYDPLQQNTDAEVEECVQTQELALQQWWDCLPAYLRIETPNVPDISPASHIITMNCLYHTFKILLYRPSLTRPSKPEGFEDSPMQSHLIECVSSATAIIAIFDLFARTFGLEYCVLSLSYSVYIAASIFLLQVQASRTDTDAMSRLQYCIRALTQLRKTSPVIASAVNVMSTELSNAGIFLDAYTQSLMQIPPTTSEYQYGSPGYHPEASSPPLSTTSEQNTATFQPQWFGEVSLDPMAVDPGVFEAMSSFEPLSVRVGVLHDRSQNIP